jgi:hypothetical protein
MALRRRKTLVNALQSRGNSGSFGFFLAEIGLREGRVADRTRPTAQPSGL